jgi:DegV family protein with EDD domain
LRKVKVITDSTADIPAELVQELEISVVPLKVHLQGQTYLDGVDIQPEEFYQKLQEANELATTSQPSPIDFVETYRAAAKEGDVDLLSIHLSSAFSGTFQSALLAKSMVEEEFRVTVIDSKKASYAIGIIVVEAARAAKEGKSLDECVALVKRMIDDMGVYFMVDTLEYLQKGGRIGKASALVGSLLNIKPILSINENGEVFPLDKVRGKSKAEARVFELIREKAGDKGLTKAAVFHASRPEEAERWAEKLRAEFAVEDLVITQIGPVVGAHVGPGTIAVVVLPA